MMSPFYYVLYLLIAIKCSFCYDYIQENNFKYTYEQSPMRNERAQLAKSVFEIKKSIHKNQLDNESLGNKEPVTQIDVNSFIQKPDEYTVGDIVLNAIDNRKSKANSNKYDEYKPLSGMTGGMAEDINSNMYLGSVNEKPDMNINLLSYKDVMNPEYSNYYPSMHSFVSNRKGRYSESKPSEKFEMYSEDTKVFHQPQKKSPLKLMKFPFFSHSRNDTQKIHKDKKRKMFCFNCLKKDNKPNGTPTKAVKDALKKVETENLNVLPTNKEGSDNSPNSIKNARMKRNEWIDDRERQLQELENIQRKVDGLEISSSQSRPND